MSRATTRSGAGRDQSAWILDLEHDANFPNLPSKIIEMICRHLTRQADRREMCLVHPSWLLFACPVLWEAPEFHTPKSFRLFYENITKSKRSRALAVRKLNLCIFPSSTKHHSTVFGPIAYCDSQEQVTALADPVVIIALVCRCEYLTSLTIYGWQLNRAHMITIDSRLPNLQSLRIIGASEEFALAGSFVRRLQRLILDCTPNIPADFVAAIGKSQLRTLQLSLRGMKLDVFERFIHGLNGQISQLTLTHTENMRDEHVHRLVLALPHLASLCLDGMQHVSPRILDHILMVCPEIQHLDIRGVTSTGSKATCFLSPCQDDGSSRKVFPRRFLRTLTLKNFDVQDKQLFALSRHCNSSLTTLGLSNCQAISDKGISCLLESLHMLYVVDCHNISSHMFRTLPWIQEVHIESSGPISPLHVYSICRSKRLKLLRMTKCPDIVHSSVGRYAIERSLTDSVTLNSTAIDALVQDGHRNCNRPHGINFSQWQLVALANELCIPLSRLENAITMVESLAQDEHTSDWSSSWYEQADEIVDSDDPGTISRDEDENDDGDYQEKGPEMSYRIPSTTNVYQHSTTPTPFITTPLPRPRSSVSVDSYSDNPPQPTQRKEFASTVGDLGGWGCTSDALSWIKESPSTMVSKPHLVEKFENHPCKPHSKPSGLDISIDEDALWGTPTKTIPWMKTEGFVHDVIEKQRSNWMPDGIPKNTGLVPREELVAEKSTITTLSLNSSDDSDDAELRRSTKGRYHNNHSQEGSATSFSQSGSGGYDSGSGDYADSSISSGSSDEAAVQVTSFSNGKTIWSFPPKSSHHAHYRESRKAIPPGQMPGRWGDFTDHAQTTYQQQREQKSRQIETERADALLDLTDNTDEASTLHSNVESKQQSKFMPDTESDHDGVVPTEASPVVMRESSSLTTDVLIVQMLKTDQDESGPSTLSQPSSQTSMTLLGENNIVLEVETADHGKQKLVLYENQAINESVRSFCNEHAMMAEHDALLRWAREEYTKHNTCRLLSKKKPNKTRLRAL